MSHRIIYIENCEYLRLYLDNLKVEYKDNDLLIPVSDIQILVIDNYRSNLSVPLINKLMEDNVQLFVVLTIYQQVIYYPLMVIFHKVVISINKSIGQMKIKRMFIKRL